MGLAEENEGTWRAPCVGPALVLMIALAAGCVGGGGDGGDGEAVVTIDGYATRSVDVDLDPGLNALDVDVTEIGGAPLPTHVVVQVLNVGHFPVTVRVIARAASGNRLYLADARLETLSAMDLATGNPTVVSDPFQGVGPAMIAPTGGAYDPETRRLFVSENRMDGVYVLDTRNPASFDRAILSR